MWRTMELLLKPAVLRALAFGVGFTIVAVSCAKGTEMACNVVLSFSKL